MRIREPVARVFPVAILMLVLCAPVGHVMASKGDIAVRSEFNRPDDNQDKPYATTAIFEGRCRDVEVPASDSRKITWLYRIERVASNNQRLNKVGILYFNDKGQEAVCVDELAVDPLLEKNVRGEMVSVLGIVTQGRYYGIATETIIILDALERLGESLE